MFTQTNHEPHECVLDDCDTCKVYDTAIENDNLTPAQAKMIIGTGHSKDDLLAIRDDMSALKRAREAAQTLLDYHYNQ